MALSPAMTFFWIGIALIIAELAILQFSVVWLLIAGLASLISATILWLTGDTSWTLGIGAFFLALVGLAAGLYAPMKRWQNRPGATQGDTALGQKAKVIAPITAQDGKVSWSGTEWQARLANANDATISDGTVEIVKFEGITVWVKAHTTPSS